MRIRLVTVVLCLVPASQGDAQEVTSDTPKETPGRYFSKPVDLWKTGRSLASTLQHLDSSDPAERVAVRENVWAQPIRTPDGNWMIYVPPKQVLDFLEAPSEANARAYLSWKAEQSQKLRHAMTLLAKVKDAIEAPHEASNEAAAAKPAPRDFPFRITYFKKPSCPHCVSQDAVLSEWLARRASGKVEVVLPGDRPELWTAYKVRGTPTLLLEAGSQGRMELLVGLQSEAALEAKLAQLALPPADPATDTRKEPAR
jgi:hypothetical protein